MPNITTPSASTLESILPDFLRAVNGGCGRRRRGCGRPAPAPTMMQQIVQLPPQTAPVAPCGTPPAQPAQPAAPSGPTGDVVSIVVNGVTRTA